MSNASAEAKKYTDEITNTEDIDKTIELLASQRNKMEEASSILEPLAKHEVSKQYVLELKENAAISKQSEAAIESISAIVKKMEADPDGITAKDIENLCSFGLINYQGLQRLNVLFARRIEFPKDPNLIRDFGLKGDSAATLIDAVGYMYAANQETAIGERQALLDWECAVPD